MENSFKKKIAQITIYICTILMVGNLLSCIVSGVQIFTSHGDELIGAFTFAVAGISLILLSLMLTRSLVTPNAKKAINITMLVFSIIGAVAILAFIVVSLVVGSGASINSANISGLMGMILGASFSSSAIGYFVITAVFAYALALLLSAQAQEREEAPEKVVIELTPEQKEARKKKTKTRLFITGTSCMAGISLVFVILFAVFAATSDYTYPKYNDSHQTSVVTNYGNIIIGSHIYTQSNENKTLKIMYAYTIDGDYYEQTTVVDVNKNEPAYWSKTISADTSADVVLIGVYTLDANNNYMELPSFENAHYSVGDKEIVFLVLGIAFMGATGLFMFYLIRNIKQNKKEKEEKINKK